MRAKNSDDRQSIKDFIKRILLCLTSNLFSLLNAILDFIIQNFKNSKSLESSKYEKHEQIWTKITTQNKQSWENQQKSKKATIFFFLSSSFVFTSHNLLHIKKKPKRRASSFFFFY